jgi:hypothetical protein
MFRQRPPAGERSAEDPDMRQLSVLRLARLGALLGTLRAGCATESVTPPIKGVAPPQQAAAADTAQSAADQVKTPAQIEVVSAQFGVFGSDESGRRLLLETDRFPAVVSAPYGWYIIFKTDKPTVVWREEFELPIAPPTWGPGEAMGIYVISPDRKTAVTERIIPTRLGFVANEWRYAPGDPLGAHAMRVYIDGQLIREFKFAIEEGPAQLKRAPRTPDRGSST